MTGEQRGAEVPVELHRQDQSLAIVWSDGWRQEIGYRRLRDACPCARCKQEARGSSQEDAGAQQADPLAVLPPEKTQPLAIESMQPVGNYAYNIHFSDGHQTGIYSFDYLRQLSGPPST